MTKTATDFWKLAEKMFYERFPKKGPGSSADLLTKDSYLIAYGAEVAAAAVPLGSHDEKQCNADWLAMLKEIVKLSDDPEWSGPDACWDDDNLLEEFDPWSVLRKLHAKAGSEPLSAEPDPCGTYECPECGRDYPHSKREHDDDRIVKGLKERHPGLDRSGPREALHSSVVGEPTK